MSEIFSALFVGLGSIGTRHLANLAALCAQQGLTLRADALRSDMHRPLRAEAQQHLTNQYSSLDDAGMLPQYDAVFLTNPTSLHAETLQKVRARGKTLFIEKPIVSAAQAGMRAEELVLPGQKAYVAAPMRWCGVMLALKEYLRQNPGIRPYSVRVLCSSYLPEWRPGVDYRTVYSAHKAMGGGVTIDLIHEWDYLMDLFGCPDEIANFHGTYSDLEIDSDDVSVYIARWPHMLGEVHLDYFGRKYRRSIELFCKDGTVTADFYTGTLTKENGTQQCCPESVNERYLREMSYFLKYARHGSGESLNPPREALDVLRLTLGQLKSLPKKEKKA